MTNRAYFPAGFETAVTHCKQVDVDNIVYYRYTTYRSRKNISNIKKKTSHECDCLYTGFLALCLFYVNFTSFGCITYPSPVRLCQMHPQLSLVLDVTSCQSSLSSGRRWSSATSTITPFFPFMVRRCCNQKCLRTRKKKENGKKTCIGASWFRYSGDDGVCKGWGGMQL